ncbi:DUF1775 domain-containing protein [Candidatus Saccharibacteria bacterium]|nr:DUF1775 domain-containing protein [Candidatus Saccharibacteria bacterium]
MNKVTKFMVVALVGVLGSFVLTSSVLAHVVVRPREVAVSEYTDFVVSVPNERSVATIAVKIEVPEGVTSITPVVKSGWEIDVEKGEESDDTHAGAVVKSITWSGGAVPMGQKDNFVFSAKTPNEAGDLRWNAYQTYEDGLAVAWDKADEEQPKKSDGSPDYSESGPFSVTRVSVPTQATTAIETADGAETETDKTLYMAISALVVAFLALIMATSKQRPTTKSSKS